MIGPPIDISVLPSPRMAASHWPLSTPPCSTYSRRNRTTPASTPPMSTRPMLTLPISASSVGWLRPGAHCPGLAPQELVHRGDFEIAEPAQHRPGHRHRIERPAAGADALLHRA